MRKRINRFLECPMKTAIEIFEAQYRKPLTSRYFTQSPQRLAKALRKKERLKKRIKRLGHSGLECLSYDAWRKARCRAKQKTKTQ
jgi:hypothetical protein